MSRPGAADRITLFSASLGPGGAERVISAMADHWAGAGRRVRLVTLSACDADFHPVDPGVERVGLGLAGTSAGGIGAVRENLRRVARLREAILAGRPDAVVSFGDSSNCLALLATVGTGLRVVVSERSNPLRMPIARSWALMRRLLYPRAHAVVAQTEHVAEWARAFVPADRVRVIPNFVRPPDARAPETPREGSARRIAAVGRLSAEKGFDLLVDAFARCAAGHPDWSLWIAGEGPDRPLLERRVADLSLCGRVEMPGLVRDVGRLLADADLFVLPSRFEGFPNALLEAMAAGVAPVAFDCESGPAAIIRHGTDGLLVPPEDVDALAAAMDRLMSDPVGRARMGREARAVTGRFGLPGIMAAWERVVDGRPPEHGE